MQAGAIPGFLQRHPLAPIDSRSWGVLGPKKPEAERPAHLIDEGPAHLADAGPGKGVRMTTLGRAVKNRVEDGTVDCSTEPV